MTGEGRAADRDNSWCGVAILASPLYKQNNEEDKYDSKQYAAVKPISLSVLNRRFWFIRTEIRRKPAEVTVQPGTIYVYKYVESHYILYIWPVFRSDDQSSLFR